MKTFKSLILTLLILLLTSFGVMAEETNIYRLYNSASGEHLYTSSENEAQELAASHGWTAEGTGWVAPDSGEGVYRLYNPVIADHLYTKDTGEVNILSTQAGWQIDNGGQPLFYSGGSIPVYRLYLPGNGRHHLTTEENEYNVLGNQGWQKEGPSIYAVGLGVPAQPQPQPQENKMVFNIKNPTNEEFNRYFPNLVNWEVGITRNARTDHPEYLGAAVINENSQLIIDPLPAGDYQFYSNLEDYENYPHMFNGFINGYFLGVYKDLTITDEMAGKPGVYDLQFNTNIGG